MKRHLCVWFPQWPIQRWHVADPALRRAPLVLFQPCRGRDVVAACCRLACAAGVRPGLPLAEARALCRADSPGSCRPLLLPDDPTANRRGLKELAWDCEAFSPLVGVEEGDAPSSLLLEITGCAACFHGEDQLVRGVLRDMQRRGFEVRLGAAETIGAAWGIAHFRTRSQPAVIIPPGRHVQALRPLPVEALRLSGETVRKLQDLDLRRVSQLLALPRQSLPSRFGSELLLRIDQAVGTAMEWITPERRPPLLGEVWQSESPAGEAAMLEQIVASLVERLLERLSPQGRGLTGVRVEFRGTGPPVLISVTLMRPTTDCRHLLNLLQLQWERRPLPADIMHIEVEATQAGVLAADEQHLWDDGARPGRREGEALIETLSSRLGPEGVVRPVLQAEQQPERAFRYQPRLEASPIQTPDERLSPFSLTRPLWLKSSPVPVTVWCVVPDGPPYRIHWEGRACTVACCWGPERITTGWWRGEHIRRDYYHVETDEGGRLWLFRDWASERWYLHAAFD